MRSLYDIVAVTSLLEWREVASKGEGRAAEESLRLSAPRAGWYLSILRRSNGLLRGPIKGNGYHALLKVAIDSRYTLCGIYTGRIDQHSVPRQTEGQFQPEIACSRSSHNSCSRIKYENESYKGFFQIWHRSKTLPWMLLSNASLTRSRRSSTQRLLYL